MNLLRVLIWEFEQNWKSPVLEFVIAGLAIISFIAPLQIMRPTSLYSDYDYFILPTLYKIIFGSLLTFIYITTIIITSRSIAGKIEKGEASLLFSYPIKRTDLIFATFILQIIFLFIPTFIYIYSSMYVLGLPNLLFSSGVIILLLFINYLFVYSIALLLSTITKSQTITILSALIITIGTSSLFNYMKSIENIGLETISRKIVENISSVSNIPDYAGIVIVAYVIVIIVFLYIAIKMFISMEV